MKLGQMSDHQSGPGPGYGDHRAGEMGHRHSRAKLDDPEAFLIDPTW